jgi:ADP-heptose:LPS heptosyltransferase
MAKTKLILQNRLSPGDIVVLTAAVRDLHRAYPGEFLTDVRTSCPALWENNPYVTHLKPNHRGVRSVECHYPLIHRSNTAPYHFIHGFINYLNDQLGLKIKPTEFKGDIHLSETETKRSAPIFEEIESDRPYWVIAAGGKYDFTIKWWHRRRWQEIVDRLGDQITFVQVGERGHYHPPLRGVIDLRGKTDLRGLIKLIYRAAGVVCPVTLHMHLAAAIPLPPNSKRLRNCIVIAGGREPAHWEQYPGHHFLHTIGQLDCCGHGGCWKSRTVALGDDSPLDRPQALCRNVTPIGMPKCMEMITASQVCDLISLSQNGN